METISAFTEKKTIKKIEEIMTDHKNGHFQLCPIKDILHTVADKWSVSVMMALGSKETMRFNELKNNVGGISQKMLTVTLRDLETYGLVTRKIYPQIPPKVEYTITQMGKEFLQHVVVLLDWACKNSSKIQDCIKDSAKAEVF